MIDDTERVSYGWGLLSASGVVGMVWVVLSLGGHSATPGILAGPVLLGLYHVIRYRR